MKVRAKGWRRVKRGGGGGWELSVSGDFRSPAEDGLALGPTSAPSKALDSWMRRMRESDSPIAKRPPKASPGRGRQRQSEPVGLIRAPAQAVWFLSKRVADSILTTNGHSVESVSKPRTCLWPLLGPRSPHSACVSTQPGLGLVSPGAGHGRGRLRVPFSGGSLPESAWFQRQASDRFISDKTHSNHSRLLF